MSIDAIDAIDAIDGCPVRRYVLTSVMISIITQPIPR
jgi:hypothetical protein